MTPLIFIGLKQASLFRKTYVGGQYSAIRYLLDYSVHRSHINSTFCANSNEEAREIDAARHTPMYVYIYIYVISDVDIRKKGVRYSNKIPDFTIVYSFNVIRLVTFNNN